MGEMQGASVGYFDVACIRWDTDSDEERIHYSDFIDRQKRDNQDVVAYAFSQVFFCLKERGVEELEIWTDTCAAQFRCRQSLFAVLQDLRTRFGFTRIRWNFFVPYHGKSLSNGHFGVIKGMLRHEAAKRGVSVDSTAVSANDLHGFLNSSTTLSNTSVFEVPEQLQRVTNVKAIPQTKSFLSFEAHAAIDMKVACRAFTSDDSIAYLHQWCMGTESQGEVSADMNETERMQDDPFKGDASDFCSIFGFFRGAASLLSQSFLEPLSSVMNSQPSRTGTRKRRRE